MSQDALARASTVSRPSITSIERGQSNPRLETLDQLARALGVDVLELITPAVSNRVAADGRTSLERIARNVNRLRAARGISQESLSEQSGHFRTYVGNLERQAVNPSLADIETVASVLEVEIEVLLAPLESSALHANMQRLVRKTRKEI